MKRHRFQKFSGFDRDIIRIPRSAWRNIEGSTKSGKERILPIHPKLKALLELRKGPKNDTVFKTKRGTPLTKNSMCKPMDRVCKKAGLRRFRFHEIRHSFASQLVCNG